MSMADFESFKDVMLSYKNEAAADSQGNGFSIHCTAMRIHLEEQEDGEERPDLDCGLTISPVGPPPASRR